MENSCHSYKIFNSSVPVPELLNFDTEQKRMSQLQEDNSLLKRQVSILERIEKEKQDNGRNDNWSNSAKFCATAEILDDFAAIPEEDHSKEGQFKSTARGLGIKKQASPQPSRKPTATPISSSAPTKSSPLPSRAFSAILGQKRDQAVPVTSTVKAKDGTKKPSAGAVDKVLSAASRQKQQQAYDRQRQELFSKPRTIVAPTIVSTGEIAAAPAQPASQESALFEMTSVPGGSANSNSKGGIISEQSWGDGAQDFKTGDDTSLPSSKNVDYENKLEPSEELPGAPPFLVLSQDEYTEHHSSISACRFSPSGTTVASMDVDGVVKVWRFSPNPATISTIMFKAPLMSLEWASKSDRMMLLGSSSGSIKMYDVEAKKPLCEVDIVSTHPRVLSLSCSPSSTSFVSSSATNARSRHRSSDSEPSSSSSKLLVWDMKVMKIQRELQLKPGVGCVNCTNYNHNGNLLVTGGMDGMIRIFDMHRYESLLSWQAHTGETYATQFSPDEPTIYSMGSDGKFIQWSINRIGEKVCDLPIHEGATGPFVMSGFGGYHRQHVPRGKLFAFDSAGKHLLTCAPYGGIIYQRQREQGLMRTLTILGHKTPVVNVDWCASFNTGMCLTGSMDGRVQVTTLLSQ
ncbi:WD repeat-containing protein 91-like isoform X1 [Amphiura filiformis]|uniref:WD repeat-containing protein 91-like isoform X1 n=1 Tax=Amphiura filiformis TaxID=82378 RepID=UPI003B20CE45